MLSNRQTHPMINICYRFLSRLVEGFVIIGATVLVTIVTIEVGLRYIFGYSLIFTEEFSRYLMVWIVFVGSALAVKDSSHISINVLPKPFKLQADEKCSN